MLIGITGTKGSGKDTFAGVLVKEAGYAHFKMAGPLKNMLRSLYEEVGIDPEPRIEGDLKEVPCNLLGGCTPRRAMQTLGTEWRDMIDRNLWTNIWLKQTENALSRGEPVVCTDIRFNHEVAALRSLGGRLIRIDRLKLEHQDTHLSETEMRGFNVDEVIYNTGSIYQLEVQARGFIKRYMN